MRGWTEALWSLSIRFRLHHYVFWILYFLFWVYVYQPGNNPRAAQLNSLVLVSVHALVSYFNLMVLFPWLLRPRKYLSYLLSVILSVLLGSMLMALIFLQLDTLDPEQKISIFTFGFILNNFIAIFTTLVLTLSLKLVKQWYERDRQNQQLQQLQTATELKFLKAQINPHFLFNVLNTLYALSIKKSEKTPDVILKLSEILRYLLYEAGDQEVPLKKELNYVRNFVELEQMRYGDRVQVEIREQGSLENILIAPMLLLTFVENSFKHGVHHSAGQCRIRLEIVSDENGKLSMRVVNSTRSSGPRRPEQERPGGLGLENVRKRLELLYPGRHKLFINNSENEFEVLLEIEPNHS